jgi:hypothetical protein
MRRAAWVGRDGRARGAGRITPASSSTAAAPPPTSIGPSLGRRSGSRPPGGPRLLEPAVRSDLEQGRARGLHRGAGREHHRRSPSGGPRRAHRRSDPPIPTSSTATGSLMDWSSGWTFSSRRAAGRSSSRPRSRLSEPGPLFKSWRRVVVGRCGCDRSAGARAYLGARPCGRRRDGRWVDPRGATPAARLWWTAARGRESRQLREPAGSVGVISEWWARRNGSAR